MKKFYILFLFSFLLCSVSMAAEHKQAVQMDMKAANILGDEIRGIKADADDLLETNPTEAAYVNSMMNYLLIIVNGAYSMGDLAMMDSRLPGKREFLSLSRQISHHEEWETALRTCLQQIQDVRQYNDFILLERAELAYLHGIKLIQEMKDKCIEAAKENNDTQAQ